jgi:sulfur dioxygenase
LFSLDSETIVYPAHDYLGRTCTTIAEEKKFNPRLTKNLDEFQIIMQELTQKLKKPAKLDEFMPLNMNCGYND